MMALFDKALNSGSNGDTLLYQPDVIQLSHFQMTDLGWYKWNCSNITECSRPDNGLLCL